MLTRKIYIDVPKEQLKLGLRQGWTLDRTIEINSFENERSENELTLSVPHIVGDVYRGRFELDGILWEITRTDFSVIAENVPGAVYTADAKPLKDLTGVKVKGKKNG